MAAPSGNCHGPIVDFSARETGSEYRRQHRQAALLYRHRRHGCGQRKTALSGYLLRSATRAADRLMSQNQRWRRLAHRHAGHVSRSPDPAVRQRCQSHKLPDAVAHTGRRPSHHPSKLPTHQAQLAPHWQNALPPLSAYGRGFPRQPVQSANQPCDTALSAPIQASQQPRAKARTRPI